MPYGLRFRPGAYLEMKEPVRRQAMVRHLKAQGALAQSIESTTGSGIPDLVVGWKGLTLFLELKLCLNKKEISAKIRPTQLAWARKAVSPPSSQRWLLGVDLPEQKRICFWTLQQVIRDYTDTLHTKIKLTQAPVYTIRTGAKMSSAYQEFLSWVAEDKQELRNL